MDAADRDAGNRCAETTLRGLAERVDLAVDRKVLERAPLQVTDAIGTDTELPPGLLAKPARAWQSLATRPIADVTLRERQEAERLGAQYVDDLVALGAGACAPLRLAAP